jgi:hypothetical protein
MSKENAMTANYGDESMNVKEELEALGARYEALVLAREKVEDCLAYIDEAESYLPEGIYGSHHSEMEWGETLCQIEDEIANIEAKL